MVLIGGDLYDGVACDEEAIIRPFKHFVQKDLAGKKSLQSVLRGPRPASAAPLGLYFITGNHEEFRDDSAYL